MRGGCDEYCVLNYIENRRSRSSREYSLVSIFLHEVVTTGIGCRGSGALKVDHGGEVFFVRTFRNTDIGNGK